MKVCPFCLGKIKEDASVCLYCDSTVMGELTVPQLASLKTRLAASLIDLAVSIVGPFFVAFIASYIMWTFTAIFTWHRSQDVVQFFAPLIPLGAWLGFSIGILLLIYYQVKWICQGGQTVGKRAMRIRIVGQNDLENVGFVRIFWLRFSMVYLVVVTLIVFIPYFWLVYLILNMALILRTDRCCLHDCVAQTRVIKIFKHHSPLRTTLISDGHLTVKRKFIHRFRK